MTNDKKARVAVIGCGAVFEAFYLVALKQLVNEGALEIVLLVDSNEKFARTFLGDFPGAKVSTSLDEGLQTTHVERAFVLTPPSSHAPIMAQLAEGNVHVYCEKPLTVSPKEARETRDHFARHGLLCKVGFARRMFPNFRAFKECFAQLGSSRTLTITDGEVFRWPIKTAGIFAPTEVGGGVVWDKLSHNLDLIQWVDGIEGIDRVHSNCRPGRVPTDILVEGRTRNGGFKVAVSWTEGLPNMVRGSDGTNTVSSKNGLVDNLAHSFTGLRAPKVPFDVTSYGDAVKASLEEFLRLRSPDELSSLASADESVALTEFLFLIDAQARGAQA